MSMAGWRLGKVIEVFVFYFNFRFFSFLLLNTFFFFPFSQIGCKKVQNAILCIRADQPKGKDTCCWRGRIYIL